MNAFQWFADMCDTIPSMDKNPHMDIDSGLLDLSYQIECVKPRRVHTALPHPQPHLPRNHSRQVRAGLT